MSAEAVVITQVPVDSLEAVNVIAALDEDLRGRYPVAAIHGLHPGDGAGTRFAFFVARLEGRVVGCGAVREIDRDMGEVKRMFVHPEYRGRGIARRILSTIETRSRELGFSILRLETGTRQPESIGLYESAGYRSIPPYGEYIGNTYSRCFEKRL
jgi:putative acetyltransferase